MRLPAEENLWKDGIAFYLDGVGFQHKYNPYDEAQSTKTMAWRKRDEGLKPNCTTKGSHVGSGGKVVHFMVAIAYIIVTRNKIVWKLTGSYCLCYCKTFSLVPDSTECTNFFLPKCGVH